MNNNYQTITNNKETINDIKNKLDLLLKEYKKNYIMYEKNKSNGEYQLIFYNTEKQVASLINKINNYENELQKEKHKNLRFLEDSKKHLKKLELSNNNSKDKLTSSQKTIIEMDNLIVQNDIFNYEIFIGIIFILFLIFKIRKTILSNKNKTLSNSILNILGNSISFVSKNATKGYISAKNYIKNDTDSTGNIPLQKAIPIKDEDDDKYRIKKN